MFARCLRAGLLSALLLLVWPSAASAEDRLVAQTHQASGTQPALPAEVLVSFITQTIAPQSWQGQGGTGTIEFVGQTRSLIVHQTAEVHQQIRQLLSDLRRHREEVCFEVFFVGLAPDILERIHYQIDSKQKNYDCLMKALTGTPVRLTDAEEYRLMEALQEDTRTTVIQTPRMTVDNGQRAALRVGEEQKFVTGLNVTIKNGSPVITPKTETYRCGIEVSLWPVVSADHRQVRVCLRAALHSIDVPPPAPVSVRFDAREGLASWEPVAFSQEIQEPHPHAMAIARTFLSPQERTMLLYGGTRERDNRTEIGPPALTGIPFLYRMFSREYWQREKEHVFVMVRPHIIVPSEVDPPPSEPVAATPIKAATSEECTAREVSNSRQHEIGVIPGLIEQFLSTHFFAEPDAQLDEKPDSSAVADLMKRYQKACADGRLDEASKLARQALAIDPTCFSRAGKTRP